MALRVTLPLEPLAEAIAEALRWRDIGLYTLLGKRLFQNYKAAEQAGMIALNDAEDICEQALDCHAYTIFGPAWEYAEQRASMCLAGDETVDACPHGHPWTEATSHVGGDGKRRCRTCRQIRKRRRRLATRERGGVAA